MLGKVKVIATCFYALGSFSVNMVFMMRPRVIDKHIVDLHGMLGQ